MTPTERARDIIARYRNDYEDWSDEEAFVEGEIRAAVAEEREACARIAEVPAVTGDARDGVQATAFSIAAAIRSRGRA